MELSASLFNSVVHMARTRYRTETALILSHCVSNYYWHSNSTRSQPLVISFTIYLSSAEPKRFTYSKQSFGNHPPLLRRSMQAILGGGVERHHNTLGRCVVCKGHKTNKFIRIPDSWLTNQTKRCLLAMGDI